MPNDNRKPEGLTESAWEELKLMAKDLAAKEVGEVKETSTKEISELRRQVSEQAKAVSEQSKKLDAAERIIEAYDKNLVDVKGRKSPQHRKTEQRLDAAKKLIEASMKMLAKGKHTKAYAEAAEKVAQALLDKSNSDRIRTFTERLVARVHGKERKAAVRKLLSTARSVAEVRTLTKALGSLVETAPQSSRNKEPLPGSRSTNDLIREMLGSSSTPNPKSKNKNSLTAKLRERCTVH